MEDQLTVLLELNHKFCRLFVLFEPYAETVAKIFAHNIPTKLLKY